MKVENLGRAEDRLTTSTERMKYDSKTLLESIRPLFLKSLNYGFAFQWMGKEIEQLD